MASNRKVVQVAIGAGFGARSIVSFWNSALELRRNETPEADAPDAKRAGGAGAMPAVYG